jgi:ubiquinone/menaquinone biosynthesis C-methylase UbiE
VDDRDVGVHWEANAPAWTALSRAGYDVFRDRLNTPAFVALLGDVAGQRGLDIGCGEGANTRTIARLGATMTGIDIAPSFVAAASEAERDAPLGIAYAVANAGALPYDDGQFDFAVAFMSLMDTADHVAAVREARRVLRPGGIFQFSIIHPCFAPPHMERVRSDDGLVRAVEVGDYFERVSSVDEWTFSAAPHDARANHPPFRIPVFHRTLADWINLLVDSGFAIERLAEPQATNDDVAFYKGFSLARTIALFLQIRARAI